MFDLDGNGQVDFEDFFIFADAFQVEKRAKLLAMAEQVLCLPSVSSLEPNYPNPFNAETTIRYTVSRPGLVVIKLYDINGQFVSTLINRHQSAGHYTTVWGGTTETGDRVSSGTYIVRMKTGRHVANRKITLIK